MLCRYFFVDIYITGQYTCLLQKNAICRRFVEAELSQYSPDEFVYYISIHLNRPAAETIIYYSFSFIFAGANMVINIFYTAINVHRTSAGLAVRLKRLNKKWGANHLFMELQ